MFYVDADYKIESSGVTVPGVFVSCKGESYTKKSDGVRYLTTVFYIYADSDYSTAHLQTISKTIECPSPLTADGCYLLYQSLKAEEFAEYTTEDM